MGYGHIPNEQGERIEYTHRIIIDPLGPIIIKNFGPFEIIISSYVMAIGCKNKTHEEWNKMKHSDILELAVGTFRSAELAVLWDEHKHVLLALCKIKAKQRIK